MDEADSAGYLGLPNPSPPARSKRAFRGILDDRLNLLKEAIDEFDWLISERTTLTERFRFEIEEEIKEVLHHLSLLPPPWKQGFLPQVEFFRSNLEKSLTSRKKDRRSMELKEWEDTASLLRERRKLIVEYEMLLRMARRAGEK